MRLLLSLIGVLLLPLTASAAETDLYEIFRKQVEQESSRDTVDAPVIEFLQRVYRKRWPLSLDEVKAAVLGQPWGACTSDDAEAVQANVTECDRALRNIQLLATEEQELRVFGRSLLRISAAQELPLSEIPGRPFHLATDLSGIINIWRAGTGSVQQTVSGAMMVRTKKLSEEDIERVREPYEKIASALRSEQARVEQGGGQNAEAFIGEIWYFQYGARLRSGARSPEYPPPINDGKSNPGTERQYYFENPAVTFPRNGSELEALWGKLPLRREDFDPPLSKNEVAYILFPDELTNQLPENILIWARVDGGAYTPGEGEKYPLGDAGLAWTYPIEPMLPSLLDTEYQPGGDSKKPILGGRYPPEPAIEKSSDDNGNPLPPGTKEPGVGVGLCSMALAQRGYLCRPYSTTNEQRCPKDPQQSNEENVITLVSCTLEDKPTLTIAGADVCREIEWKKGQDNDAIRCDVKFYQGNCGAEGRADPNTEEGKLGICVGNPGEINMTYVLEHDLVHAQQFCGMKAGDVYDQVPGEGEEKRIAADELCCRLEGEAHLVSCKRMFDDGLLRAPGGDPAFIKGVKVTPQICMEIARLQSCKLVLERDVKCPMTGQFTVDDFETLKPFMTGNPKNLPNDFETATNPKTMDAHLTARLRTIERHVPICTPGTETTYKNTIGNNVCYIGQCVEETLELHRITAGRSPAIVGDGAFPHDNHDTGEALATLLRSVPATSPPLPSYRPQLVARMLEDAFCQLQGLPAGTPPHLCSFSPSRRLAIPLGDPASTTKGLLQNDGEQREASLVTEQLASGLGSRIGTDMQGQYLRIGTRTLSEVVALANTLLQEAITVTFPTNMCRLSL